MKTSAEQTDSLWRVSRMKPMFFVAVVTLLAPFPMLSQTPSPDQAAQTSTEVVKADQAFTSALAQGDKAAAGKFLDRDFEFTNPDGKTFNKAEMIAEFPHAISAAPGATEVHAYNYGQVADVYGTDSNTLFLRVWVQRGGRWQLFNYIETAIGPRIPLAPGGADCINPCHTIPYSPKTAQDKAILDAWQHAKMDEWHPDSSDWALRVGDEFSIINSGTNRSKAQRVGMLARQQQEGQSGPPGDPIHDIRMFDFGPNAAVMLSKHTPHRGGKPYYNVRLWILRDGRWQLVASQQTTIQTAEPEPPAA
jgi:hypothetical protein